MLREWNIQSTTGVCSVSGRAFADGEFYYTLLEETPQGMNRHDFSMEAWKQRTDEIKALSFWKAEFKVPPAAPPEALRKEDAESLLRKLLAQERPENRNACFILAVMLERKKQLKQRDRVEKDGETVLVYEHIGSGELLLVVDPQLKLAQLEEVQKEVSLLLGGSGTRTVLGEAQEALAATVKPVESTPAAAEDHGANGTPLFSGAAEEGSVAEVLEVERNTEVTSAHKSDDLL